MVKITKFGYDIYELQYDLGSGKMLKTKQVKGLKDKTFKSVGGALKWASEYLGTTYRKADWCFEEDLDCAGRDGWVLHIIVDKNMKWANHKMITEFHKGKLELRDLLVNVFVDKDEK